MALYMVNIYHERACGPLQHELYYIQNENRKKAAALTSACYIFLELHL